MASIAVVGSGFVGQANGKVLARQGHRVLFIDIDPEKLAALRKESYRVTDYEHLPLEKNIDIFFISVPTPTTNGRVQLRYLEQAAQDLGGFLAHRDNHPLIVLKSTVPPGTTRRILIPILEEASGKKYVRDFSVAFEPEYLREVSSLQDAAAPRLVTIGSQPDDQFAGSVLGWLRSAFHVPIEHLAFEEAEMQKYVHNLFNASKISFFNEMRQVCRRLQADCDKIFAITAETAEASWNPRYGTRDFGAFDGSCLPKDTSGFLDYARRELDMEMPLLDAVIQVNENLKPRHLPAPLMPLPTIPNAQTYEFERAR